MDKEKAHKFLSLDDRLTVEGIEATHEMGSNHPAGIAEDETTFDGSNAKTRHRHRGKLLGVINRLLGTTAYYHGSYQHEAKSAKAHKDAYERAAAELNAANAKLTQLEAFGTLSPWFGGPYAALTINAHYRDKVFGEHKGTSWSFRALSERVVALESENDQLGKLADKPMQILDDAQGYYTVTDPFDKNGRVTVKQITERNARQFETIQRKDETIQRKDEKILEQAKEIKRLKEQNAGILAAGLIPLRTQVQLPNGGVLELGDLISRYLSQASTISRYHEEQDSYRPLKAKLRQTQEDLGDMTVAHNEACETIDMLNARLDKLNARLDKIDEMALDISHVAGGSTDPEEENGESVSVDFETRGVSPVGWDFGKPGSDFTVVAYKYSPATGRIKRKD